MTAAASLQGLRVLVTRPAAQAQALCELLEARGAVPLRLPLQAIEPVRQPALAARSLRQAQAADAWIFTSANAVQHAHALQPGLQPGPWPPAIAIGAATAAALRRLGHDADLPDGAYTSEGLLQLPLLQAAAGRRFAVITGVGGRELLAPALLARGAQVEVVAVYRRLMLPQDPRALAAMVSRAEIAIVTSGEALARLFELMPVEQRPLLLRLPLVVPSRRVVEEAVQLGFVPAPLLPEQVTDTAYLHCLELWRR